MRKKKIILGVCGSIAAVKSYEVSRRLAQAGYDVQVVLTDAAKNFVAELPFQVFTGKLTASSLFEVSDVAIRHVELAKEADLLLILAATAQTIAKLHHGIADNLLTALSLARPSSLPTVIVPAMNENMWANDATKRNVASLRKQGLQFWGPASGELACGVSGEGRMIEADEVVLAVETLFKRSSEKRGKIVITAGATQEFLDPVRYLSNPASGKSGKELALAAYRKGFDVVLIGANLLVKLPPSIELIAVSSVDEMKKMLLHQLEGAKALIMNAAVGDYTPVEISEKKLKKSSSTSSDETLTITLRKTEDLCALARKKFPHLVIAGYAAETENCEENARKKLEKKGLNLICLNQVASAKNSPFGANENRLKIFHAEGLKKDTGMLPKSKLAEQVIASLLEELE